MPTVVISAVVAAVGVTGVAATVATVVLGTAATLAINTLTAKKGGSAALSAGERIDLVRSAVMPRRVIYGQARVGGPLIFAYTTDLSNGRKNFLLHLVVALASHEIAEFGDLYVNDEVVPFVAGADGWKIPPLKSTYLNGAQQDGANGNNLIQWRALPGTPDQAADRYLMRDVPVWTSAHRLRGLACLYVKLYWDRNIWAAGLPNLSMVVKGKKVYDPRTGQTAWSDNPALCLRDYLLADFGLACSPEEIDEASFIAAANLCDERVPVTGGADQKRYTCNGVLSLDQKPIEIVEQMLSSCAGALIYTQGRYRLMPAAYRTPRLELNESHLRGPVVVRPQTARKQRCNTVRGTFIDPNYAWQSSDFPPVSTASYVEADGGEVVAQELELPFTNNSALAQRLAQLHLERARHALTIEMPCTLAAMDVTVMEPVRVSLASLGWSDKVFLPVEWQLGADGGVDLVLQEEDPALYAWTGGVNSTSETPALVLPDLYPAAPLMTLGEGVEGGLLRLIVTLNGLDDAFVMGSEVEYRLLGTESWQSAGTSNPLAIAGVAAGETYEVRARILNTLGRVSAWTLRTRQIVGNAVPPGDISNLTASLIDSTLYLDWQPPAGLIASYRLRWSPLVSGANWASAVDISSQIANTRAAVPAQLGTYMVKAVDVFGRASANPATYINLTPDGRGAYAAASRAEHPLFSGSKSNVVVNGSHQLVIDSLAAFDAQSGAFDSNQETFDNAGGGLLPEGIYTFASPVDLGAVYLCRVSGLVQASVIDLTADIDAAPDTFDTREGLFDGEAPSAVDVILEVATTRDDPAGSSPTWSAWQRLSLNDLTARGLKFRARLTSANLMATPAVETLGVTVEVPERVAAGSGLTSAPAGDTITFSPAFMLTPAITITPGNMQTGDYFVISGKSRTGFTVQFKNAAGTGISRNYDYVARGYGREQ